MSLSRTIQTVHPLLRRLMHVAAIAGIAAFVSFPVAPQVSGGANIARWLGELITYTR